MTEPLRGISSLATRALLAELVVGWDGAAAFTTAGGLEAARLLRDGAEFDVVVLAEAALRSLESEGLLRPGSRRAVVASSMAAAVRIGSVPPDLSSAEAFRRALRSAGRIGHSTGPSGEKLLRSLTEWGLRDALAAHLVQAPPGVPVGRLLADGAVDLAVQQRSELMGIDGIVIVGDLPPGAGSDTVFAAAVAMSSGRPEEAARLVGFLADAPGDIKQRHGLRPA